jgi:uroporphyrinogen III methyltransferase/synthase
MRPDPSLRDCTIILTRPSDEAGALAAALGGAGARVLECPAIEFASLIEQSLDAIRAMLGALGERGGWLALPSPTAVRHFGEVLARLHLAPADLAPVRIAAIGAGSAAALGAIGLKPAFTPPKANAAALAASLPAEPGAPVVIMGSRQTRPELRDGLAKRGFMTQTLPLYAPRPSEEGLEKLRAALAGRPAGRPAAPWMIAAASPSAVDAICDSAAAGPGALAGLGWIAIGPTTRKAMAGRGIDPARTIEAAEPGDAAFVEAAAALAARLRAEA